MRYGDKRVLDRLGNGVFDGFRVGIRIGRRNPQVGHVDFREERDRYVRYGEQTDYQQHEENHQHEDGVTQCLFA